MNSTVESIIERLKRAQNETQVVLVTDGRPKNRGDERDELPGEPLARQEGNGSVPR